MPIIRHFSVLVLLVLPISVLPRYGKSQSSSTFSAEWLKGFWRQKHSEAYSPKFMFQIIAVPQLINTANISTLEASLSRFCCAKSSWKPCAWRSCRQIYWDAHCVWAVTNNKRDQSQRCARGSVDANERWPSLRLPLITCRGEQWTLPTAPFPAARRGETPAPIDQAVAEAFLFAPSLFASSLRPWKFCPLLSLWWVPCLSSECIYYHDYHNH